MRMKLFAQAILKFMLGAALVGCLIFLPAGTLRFSKGWLLMGILFIPMLGAGFVMLLKSPQLLRSRLNGREKFAEQSRVVRLSGLMFVLGFALAGLDFRFGWTALPDWVSRVSALVFLLAYVLYAEVLRENVWLSRTIGVREGQKVVDTGLYGIVRHPMYAATMLLFLSMPLVLGSLIAFAVFMAYPFIISARIRHEEAVLERELQGYAEYRKKIKYKMIPYVW